MSDIGLGFGIGLQGKPKDYDNITLERMKLDQQKQAVQAKRKPDDFSKYIKLDFNRYHPVVQQEALDVSNDLFDYMKQKQADPANAYTNWGSSPEFQRKLTETKLKLGKLEGESKRINEGIKEYMTNKDKDAYEINQAADNILSNSDNLDVATLNKAYRNTFGGDYSADKHFSYKGKDFDISQDINKNALPQVRNALVSQGYATQNPDGTITTVSNKTITPDVIENIGKNLLSNNKRLSGVNYAYNTYVKNNPEEELKYNGAQDWYIRQQLAPFIKNQTVQRLSGKSTDSLFHKTSDNSFENKDFRFSVDSGAAPFDLDTQYQDYLQKAKQENLGEKALSKESYATKVSNDLLGSEGLKGGTFIAATPKDKAAENKISSYKLPDGSILKGNPIGVSDAAGLPMIIMNVVTQKAVDAKRDFNKDTKEWEIQDAIPEVIEQRAVPFTGGNKLKFASEYAGINDVINEKGLDWGQKGVSEYSHVDKKGHSVSETNKSSTSATKDKNGIITITTKDQYDVLPSGSEYLDANGVKRRKK